MRRRVVHGFSAVQRRLSDTSMLIRPPEVDHAYRNEVFGDERRIGVLHIPKAAGSSVSTSLVDALADRSWSPYVFDPELFGPFRDEAVPVGLVDEVLPHPSRLRDANAASGHFALSTMLAGFDAADIVMILREPRSRVLSLYEYWRGLPLELRDPSRSWSVVGLARELDFEQWLLDPRVAYQTDNVVLRMLLHGHRSIPDDDFIEPEQLVALTPLAVRAAQTVGWVDVVERGHDMWSGLGARIGRPLQRSTVNTTARRPDLPTDVAAMFSDIAVEALYRRTAADAVIWTSAAQRRSVETPDLLAERTWVARFRAVFAAQGGLEHFTSPPA